MNHLLIVDDEAEIREALGEILKEDGYAVTSTASASEAMVLLRDASYDVLLLDIWLPDRDGLEVLTEIRSLEIESLPEVIIISGHGTIETAVRATKLGAFDFLEKPLSIDRTLILLKNAVEAKRLRSENQEFKRQLLMHVPITGDDDYFGQALDLQRTDLGQHFQTVPVGQPDVQQQHIIRRVPQQNHSLGCAGGARDGVPIFLEDLAQRFADLRFVVDDQDVVHAGVLPLTPTRAASCALLASASGSSMMNRAPVGLFCSARMAPLCSWMIFEAIASPRPVPRCLVEK